MNLLHVVVFVFGGFSIAIFAIKPEVLDKFGIFFGSTSGADMLVYLSLILLFYFYIELVNKHTKDKIELTRLISYTGINEAYIAHKDKFKTIKNLNNKDEFVFAIRAYNEGSCIGQTIDEIIKS
jgi:hypothetical protein